MKIRIKFKKYGAIKFIGHLDVMRSFQKIFRRAGIDVTYSQGFSPHQLMSFSAPLGVGITSDGEYLDLNVNSITCKSDMMKKINDVSVDGITITDIILLNDGAQNSMSIVSAASYIVTIRDEAYNKSESKPDAAEFIAKFNEFMQQEDIVVMKKTKKSVVETDIKPHIFEYKDGSSECGDAIVYDNKICIYLLLSTGSVVNLKPNLVMETFCKYAGYDFDEYAFQYHRLDMFSSEDDTKLIPLSEVDKNNEQTDFYR